MKYKTAPRGKQAEVIEGSRSKQIHALLCRPGTGKSKICLDTAAWNYLHNVIDALIVIAPEGVDRQWIEEAVPRHLSPEVHAVCRNYAARMGKRAYEQLENLTLIKRERYLVILTLTFDGIQTPRGRALVRKLQECKRTMVVVDESHRVSNIKSAAHKAIKPVVRAARVRRIGTGTLVRQNPFSAYGQFDLMGDGLLGCSSLTAFKSMYAEMLPPNHPLVANISRKLAQQRNLRNPDGSLRVIPIRSMQAKDEETGRPIYRNLGHLRRMLEEHSSFLTLADVNGAEPVVNEDSIYVDLEDEQRRIYDDLVRYGVAQAPGGQLTAEGALALATRLAQVAGGFAPSDDDPDAKPVCQVNPKVKALFELLEELEDEKVVIWCKFQAEIKEVAAALDQHRAGSVCEYHGRMSSKAKDESKRDFMFDPSKRYFVGQEKAGGTGLDGLQAVARYMVFYSNDYPYLERHQAISRLARTDGSPVVQVYDIIAQHTVDEDVVACLRAAEDVSEAVLARAIVREWE